jgi:hypothetical protein
MRSHLEILFDLEAREQEMKFRHLGLVSVFLGFGNLLLCAFVGPILAADRLGPPLLVLLFLEFSALLFIHVFYFLSISDRVLTGTELLPLGMRTLTLFAVTGTLRRPFGLAIAGPVALLLGVTFRTSPPALLFGPLCVLLATAGVSVWTGVLLSAGRRRNPQTVTAGLLLLVPGVVFLALLLDLDSVLAAVPPVGLTAAALRSAAGGNVPHALLFTGCLGALVILPFLAPRYR